VTWGIEIVVEKVVKEFDEYRIESGIQRESYNKNHKQRQKIYGGKICDKRYNLCQSYEWFFLFERWIVRPVWREKQWICRSRFKGNIMERITMQNVTVLLENQGIITNR